MDKNRRRRTNTTIQSKSVTFIYLNINMMTMSNNVTLGITFLAIICVVIVAIVSTTSSLLHANDIDSVDAPKASMLLRRKRSRQLWTPARDVGEVPVEIKESVDPHLLDFVVAGFQKCGTTYLQVRDFSFFFSLLFDF